ncbi:ABC transporter substrate-binding protein [Paenibacillus macquariensis]|uniref:Iron complex transport system substrate-binding protein n=1 Tax=Paenibacillus macquariensis TaxID=948756 RepID=A0ABY1K4H2_9BACL|nr:ABC transporter substrate-binding protein [Paenibacillus macquariensis]MEC0088999.1 ABC transporter substrate-binding protein [Paenibacillus macquariensis]OAB31864.1 ABC transporter [Paenibacillus macquariensis subsp. macquariensis]SIR24213.1 iron complex transport system substrate-binding protein [Paenibacillus macquariensis]
MRNRKWFGLILLVGIISLVVGCADNSKMKNAVEKTEKAPAQVSEEVVNNASFPRTIKHMEGETVIKEKPLKIATPYISFVDYLAVLDEYPIAGQGIEIIERNFPYLSKMIEGKDIIDLGQEVSLERLLASEPDLIIAANDMADKYEQLSQIAPTVIFPEAGDWRKTLIEIAKVIGKEDKADTVLAEFDRKSAKYKEQLAFRSGESVMFAMYSGKEQFVLWEEKRFDAFYIGLGLKPTEGAEIGGRLTLEGVVDLNPDHLFIVNNWQEPIEGGVKEDLKDNKVWQSLSAVQKDQVYYLEDPSLPGPLALAKIKGIDEVMEAMGKK